ncbi:MAG: HypC/HybG/HupF family hydrogenase formation chaperone [Ignavibacteriales bacterium]|nr:HypC/HybG/HupF family hydrogenase formation chaperone [Ignavibacteriales bacterium]
MNLQSAKIMEIYIEDGTTLARVCFDGEIVSVPILFLAKAKVGDVVLIESGVAVSTLEPDSVCEGIGE